MADVHQPRRVRRLAIVYLIVQGVGALIWWAMLLFAPSSREPFLAAGAPDSTLLAFLTPDLVLFAGASLLGRVRAGARPGVGVARPLRHMPAPARTPRCTA